MRRVSAVFRSSTGLGRSTTGRASTAAAQSPRTADGGFPNASIFNSGDLEFSDNNSQSHIDGDRGAGGGGSSGLSGSGTNAAATGAGAASPEGAVNNSNENAIAQKETRDVLRLRLLVLLVLVSLAIGVAVTTYIYLSNAERRAFHNQFTDDSNKLLEAIGQSLDKTLGTFDSLAVTLVSSAKAAQEEWPFTALPNFGVRLAKVLPLSDAFNTIVLPVVTADRREAWERYVVQNDYWVNESMAVQATWDGYYGPPLPIAWSPNPTLHNDLGDLPVNSSKVHFPQWQNFPVIPEAQFPYSYDWGAVSAPEAILTCYEKHRTVVSEAYMIPEADDVRAQEETAEWAEWHRDFLPPTEEAVEPVSDIFYPIIDDLTRVKVAGADDYNPAEHRIVGIVAASYYWRAMLRGILPTDSNGTVFVVDNPCTQSFSYMINGPFVQYMGVGDRHDHQYNNSVIQRHLWELGMYATRNTTYSGALLDREFCPFTLNLYPSDTMKAKHTTNHPIVFTVIAMLLVTFTSLIFFLYDRTVERRQEKVLQTAQSASAIVSSLFPAAVRSRLFAAETPSRETARGRLQTFLADDNDCSDSNLLVGCPIAELYPETTVFFADIAGFTAWSSVRSPTEVFHLLETIYGAFDKIAKRRRVFKIETIGDSYVAVVGLPTPRKHHAAVMAKFAADCRTRMAQVTLALEKSLGPGTADLTLRIGLNSGPTTAGVLRGDKARFQLFGDTVNTAARMESTGERNKIQVSQKTADLIIQADRGYWLTPREDMVNAKGKGTMQTYWCEPDATCSGSAPVDASEKSLTETEAEEAVATLQESHLARLIDWNVEMFDELLCRLSSRDAAGPGSFRKQLTRRLEGASLGNLVLSRDESSDAFSLPKRAAKSTRFSPDNTTADATLDPNVVTQLRTFITEIANMHRPNEFHNFEHCSHVSMATKKLLERIADHEMEESERATASGTTNDNHNELYRSTLDPLTHFALAFAALIHDVNHPGVCNEQLVSEGAQVDGTKSINEQNAIDASWALFLEPRFSELRACIYTHDAEQKRFRRLVVNSVMATDLYDPDLRGMRELRWQKSFNSGLSDGDDPSSDDDARHKAAFVIIDLISQVSYASHSMQHFTVYAKWNMCLLTETRRAYQTGRHYGEQDPAETWYDNQLLFFKDYVIPLAQQLRECGVFGVSCDEFLDYAKDNLLEWETNGREIVREAVRELDGTSEEQNEVL